jgi:hypothetical protein
METEILGSSEAGSGPITLSLMEDVLLVDSISMLVPSCSMLLSNQSGAGIHEGQHGETSGYYIVQKGQCCKHITEQGNYRIRVFLSFSETTIPENEIMKPDKNKNLYLFCYCFSVF